MPSGAKRGQTGLTRAMQGLAGPSGAKRGLAGPRGVTRGLAGPGRAKQGQAESSGVKPSQAGPSGAKQAQAGPRGGRSDGKMEGGKGREREKRERERPLLSIISPALRYSSHPYTTDQALPTFSGKFRQVASILLHCTVNGFSAITSSYVCQSS